MNVTRKYPIRTGKEQTARQVPALGLFHHLKQCPQIIETSRVSRSLTSFNLHFCRRFSSEKCPTLTVASFFSFFFRQTTISL